MYFFIFRVFHEVTESKDSKRNFLIRFWFNLLGKELFFSAVVFFSVSVSLTFSGGLCNGFFLPWLNGLWLWLSLEILINIKSVFRFTICNNLVSLRSEKTKRVLFSSSISPRQFSVRCYIKNYTRFSVFGFSPPSSHCHLFIYSFIYIVSVRTLFWKSRGKVLIRQPPGSKNVPTLPTFVSTDRGRVIWLITKNRFNSVQRL